MIAAISIFAISVFSQSQFFCSFRISSILRLILKKNEKKFFVTSLQKVVNVYFLQTQVHSYFLNLFLESADKNNFLMQLLHLRQRGGGHPPPSTQII